MRELTLSKLAILMARVLLLCIAGAALVFGFLVSWREPHGLDPGGSYTCPMHPEVNSSTPGDCPICRMALEPRKAQPAPDVASSDGDLSPTTFQLPLGAEIQSFDEIGYGKMLEESREMRASAWAETDKVGRALFYRDDAALLDPNEKGMFFPSVQPDEPARAGIKVTRINESPRPWDRATVLVGFQVQEKEELTPGQIGSLKFPTRVRDILTVRTGAIVRSQTGPYVLLVAKDNRTLTKRPIEIGSVFAEHAAVLSGLAVGERVAVLNTFFLDAERRFTGRAEP